MFSSRMKIILLMVRHPKLLIRMGEVAVSLGREAESDLSKYLRTCCGNIYISGLFPMKIQMPACSVP